MYIVIPGKEELYNINLRLIEKLMKFLYQCTFKYVKNGLIILQMQCTKNQAKLSPVSWIYIVLILNLPEIIVVITPTLSSFGALLSSFIRAKTIGRDIVRPFIAAIFRGPIFSFTVVS